LRALWIWSATAGACSSFATPWTAREPSPTFTGIARNILTDRLRRLTERGILDRQTAPSGKRQVYALTRAGRDLSPQQTRGTAQ
jgi:DNA-binding HxlR family transcriptional regulator